MMAKRMVRFFCFLFALQNLAAEAEKILPDSFILGGQLGCFLKSKNLELQPKLRKNGFLAKSQRCQGKIKMV